MYEIKNTETAIDLFRGENSFLSNFYEGKRGFIYKGMSFTNSEAAYQSQKCIEREKEFAGLKPSESKKLGRKVALRPDWNEVRNDVMYEVCKAKFTQDHELLFKLLLTGDRELVEGSFYHYMCLELADADKYWGMVKENDKWIGENNLGIVLMKLRSDLKKELDLEDVKVPENLKCPEHFGHHYPYTREEFYSFLDCCSNCMYSQDCDLTIFIEELYDALHPEGKEQKEQIKKSIEEMQNMIIQVDDGYILGEALNDDSYYKIIRLNTILSVENFIKHFTNGQSIDNDKIRNIKEFPVFLCHFPETNRIFTHKEMLKMLDEEKAVINNLLNNIDEF